MTWLKICGTTNLQDAQSSVAAGASALGFIFAPSPRRIDVATAAEIISALRSEVEAIGVFVNETPERVAEIADQAGLTGVQLHGDEAAASLPEFRRALEDRKVIKTLSARALEGGEIKLGAYLAARDSLDAILLDSGSGQQRGGTGASFDWDAVWPIAQEIRKTMPLIIAGGLTSDNVGQAIERFEPWGVDVVTGVEASPGRKDEAKLRDFVAAVRQVPISVRQRE
jgi:phosphoribosylanthranilate isomerase